MSLFLLCIALVIPTFAQPVGQQPRGKSAEKMPVQKIDGEYTVTYAEIDGKKVEGKGFTQVTIKNNVATCRHDGKEKSWRMEFGPHNMIRCTEMTEGKVAIDLNPEKRDINEKGYHTHYGVYIASPDYFCLSMNKGRDHRASGSTEGKEGTAQPGSTPRFGQEEPRGAHFVLILHRSGTQTSNSR